MKEYGFLAIVGRVFSSQDISDDFARWEHIILLRRKRSGHHIGGFGLKEEYRGVRKHVLVFTRIFADATSCGAPEPCANDDKRRSMGSLWLIRRRR
jgi:hypothetical protein